jgi:pimeloyl-ACP methyl ester carboxylesterase
MNEIRSRRINVGGLNIRYYTGGKGEPLVVVHGGNSHAGPWAKNLRELAQKYTVFVPDLPGFGLSQKMAGDYHIPDLTNFISEFTKSMGLESFYLMGHSLGGAIAASYTVQHPEQVKKLILIDSMGMGEDIALWIKLLTVPGIAKYLGKSVVGVLKGVKWTIEAMFRSMEFILPVSEASLIIGCGSVGIQTESIFLKQKLSGIVAPTLIVWGDKDRIVPVKQAYATASAIPGCQLRILGGGHCAYQDRLPEFSRTVRNFLD